MEINFDIEKNNSTSIINTALDIIELNQMEREARNNERIKVAEEIKRMNEERLNKLKEKNSVDKAFGFIIEYLMKSVREKSKTGKNSVKNIEDREKLIEIFNKVNMSLDMLVDMWENEVD